MAIDPIKLQKQLDAQKKKASAGVGVDVSRQLELQYYRALDKNFVQPVAKQIEKELLPILEREEKFYIANYDPSNIQAAIRAMRSQWLTIEKTAEEIAAEMAKQNSEFNRKKFVKQINKAVGIDISHILADSNVDQALRASVTENVALIKTMPAKQFDRIERAVLQGVTSGDDFFSIRKDLIEVGEISERRAKLIARDQVSKLNGNLNRIRQDDIGITHYFWRTSEDERVRPDHRDNNGKRFAWNSPPATTGHPGEDIQCRCTADPDLRNLRIINA
jgi:SPP1 gp7 family putative phage head morphogenesis protein